MPYTPPAGNDADFNFTVAYTAPAGNDTDFEFVTAQAFLFFLIF